MAPTGKTVAIASVVVVALLVAYTLYESAGQSGPVTNPVPTKFTVNGKTYAFTYVATTDQERRVGLMGKAVNSTTTMLFAFPSAGEWRFWMYNTTTSLDMIWVNSQGDTGRVVYLVSSVPPCFDISKCVVYTPTASANYVIEAKSGFASSNGIDVGTTFVFSGFRAST